MPAHDLTLVRDGHWGTVIVTCTCGETHTADSSTAALAWHTRHRLPQTPLPTLACIAVGRSLRPGAAPVPS